MSHVRHLLRSLRRDPLVTGAAVGSLALGLAAATAMFTVLNALLITPPPYRDGGDLLLFEEVIEELRHQYPTVPASGVHFLAWRERCRACGDLAALHPVTFTLTGAGEPARVASARVSANLFRLLGVQPRLGRDFRDDEDAPGRERVVMLSDAIWRERFSASPGVVGRSILLDGEPHDVVGVLPPGFRLPRGNQLSPLVRFPDRVDLFRPIAFGPDEQATAFNYPVLGRLAPGATVDQATAELAALQTELARQSPMPMTLGIALRPLHDQMVGDVRDALILLMGATALVLLIVCVNIANLLLARHAARRRDAALRLAIGAGRWRVVRGAMVESGAIATAGCALGLLLAWWSVDALVAFAPAGLPRLDEIAMDGRVLAFGAAAAAGAAVLFGMLPAMRLAATRASELLRAGSPGADAHPGALRLREGLLAIQVGMCVLLLSTSGLVARSYDRLSNADRGFHAEDMLTFEVSLPRATHGRGQARNSAIAAMLEELGSMPGVVAAGVADTLPLSGRPNVNIVSLEHDPRPAVERPAAHRRYVNGDYFRAMGIPIIAGRTFRDTDRGQPVVILSARTAEALWPGQPSLGRRLHTGDTDTALARVIGVTADTRTVDLGQVDPLMVYEPYWIVSDTEAAFVLRAGGDPLALARTARDRIHAVVPDAPVSQMQPMSGRVTEALAGPRFQTILMLLFSALAFVIANVGVYGVTAYAVSRRARELGIRAALGAGTGDLYRLVFRGTLRPLALGLAAGVAGALVVHRLIAGALFGVPAADPLALAAVAAVVTAAALAASFVPARRAARADPAAILRQE
jgi:putative ABC transport system permease protein